MGTVLLLNTNDTNVVNNNQQIQAREICIAGLDVMFDHMKNAPSDYTTVLTKDIEDIHFTMNVNIPFAVYADTTNFYLDGTDQFTDANVKIDVVADTTQTSNSNIAAGTIKLIATATTEYALTDTQVKLEVFYKPTSVTNKFEKGRFIN